MNMEQAQKIDFGKMIAESVKSEIAADPDFFLENMMWLAKNSSATIPPTGKPYKYTASNTRFTDKQKILVKKNGTNVIKSGVITINFNAAGALIENQSEAAMACNVSFKQVQREKSVHLNASGLETKASKNIGLSSKKSEYLLVITNNSERMLSAASADDIEDMALLKYYLIQGNSVDQYNALVNDSNKYLDFLENEFMPSFQLSTWLELSRESDLSTTVLNAMSIPTEKYNRIKDIARRQVKVKDYRTVLASDIDNKFGAIPIVITYNGDGVSENKQTIAVANLSDIHAELLFKDAAASSKPFVDKIEPKTIKGSVSIIDLTESSYKDYDMAVAIEVIDIENEETLFRIGDTKNRYRIR